MNLKEMSDDELFQIAGIKSPVSKLGNQELMKLAGIDESSLIQEPGLEETFISPKQVAQKAIEAVPAVSSAIESVTGAPTRAGVAKYQETGSVPQSVRSFISQFGEDPSKAPDFGLVGNIAADWTNLIPVLGQVGALKKIAKSAKEAASLLDIAQLGAKTPEIRKIRESKAGIEGTAKFLREKGVTGITSSIEKANEKLGNLVDEIGQGIGEVYKQATQKGARVDTKQATDVFFDSLSKRVQKMPLTEDQDLVVRTANKYMQDISSATNPEQLHKIRVGIDKKVKDWSKDPGRIPRVDALRAISKAINDSLQSSIKNVDPQLSSRLSALNKDYGIAKNSFEQSEKALTRYLGNMAGKPFGIGPLEALTGLAVGSSQEAILPGLAAAYGFKAARKIGPSVGSPLLRGFGGAVESLPSLYKATKPLTVGNQLRLKALED